MRTHRIHQSRGSVFTSAVIFAGILAIMVAGLLKYMTNEYILNQQSHLWNQAIHLSEAATEVAFAEFNYQYFQGGAGVGFQSSRGWTNLGSNAYSKNVRSFTNGLGKVIGSLSITVSNATSINPSIMAIGTATNTVGRAPVVARAVLTTLYKSSHFPVSLLSKDRIDMNGNNVYVDSYDSSDLTKSTSKLYDPAKKQFNGNVASNGTITNSINIGNADVYGVAYTGVGGSVSLGANGSIGPTFVTADRATTVASAASQGWIQSDFNVDVPSVVLPTGVSWTKPPGTTGTGNGTISKSTTLGTGDYMVDSVTLNSSAHGDTLLISGTVRLYVTGTFDISGLGQLQIDPTGSLTVYIGGNATIAGNGWVNNAGTPDKNIWFALDTSTSWSVVGNGTFIGAIYAPNATVSFKGGGANGDASGSIVAKKIVLTGNTKFHYDENLKNANTGAGYSVVAWQELRRSGNGWVKN